MSKSRILIVEDEVVIRSALKRLLERHGYTVFEAGSIDEAVQSYSFQGFHLIITDLRLPGARGTDLIHLASGIPVLVMTSYASLNSAVDTMKMGAVDYIAKPFDHNEMLARVEAAILKIRVDGGLQPLSSGYNDSDFNGIIGQSDGMRQLFCHVKKVSPTAATVLIQGESGTGKELVAKAIHANSLRASGPMISVNCAAIPETLIESELFGHEKGSFTGASQARTGLIEAANGGTLFLDEIGELPLEAQARLLRVLQEGEIRRVGSVRSQQVDIRLISATHRNLRQLTTTGKFREDLYYRLKVVELRIPALRDRGKDILTLAQRLLEKVCENMGKASLSYSPEALMAINQYPWPGNVREMEHAIERAVILCEGGIITPDNLDLEVDNDTHPLKQDSLEIEGGLTLEDYFQRFVLEHEKTMTETELSQKLGISRKTLWERRQKLGIPRRKNPVSQGPAGLKRP